MSRKLLIITSVLAAMFCVTLDSSTAEAGRFRWNGGGFRGSVNGNRVIYRNGSRGGSYGGYRGGYRNYGGWRGAVRPAYRWGYTTPYYGGYYY